MKKFIVYALLIAAIAFAIGKFMPYLQDGTEAYSIDKATHNQK